MALRLTLRPGERVIIGGAVIRNGDHRADFLIENRIPVLRQTDILSPAEVETPCQRIYLAVQLMYVEPAKRAELRATFDALVKDVAAAAPSCSPMLAEITELVESESYYKALKTARGLIDHEMELMKNVS